jgi:hypothetical protein
MSPARPTAKPVAALRDLHGDLCLFDLGHLAHLLRRAR